MGRRKGRSGHEPLGTDLSNEGLVVEPVDGEAVERRTLIPPKVGAAGISVNDFVALGNIANDIRICIAKVPEGHVLVQSFTKACPRLRRLAAKRGVGGPTFSGNTKDVNSGIVQSLYWFLGTPLIMSAGRASTASARTAGGAHKVLHGSLFDRPDLSEVEVFREDGSY